MKVARVRTRLDDQLVARVHTEATGTLSGVDADLVRENRARWWRGGLALAVAVVLRLIAARIHLSGIAARISIGLGIYGCALLASARQ